MPRILRSKKLANWARMQWRGRKTSRGQADPGEARTERQRRGCPTWVGFAQRSTPDVKGCGAAPSASRVGPSLSPDVDPASPAPRIGGRLAAGRLVALPPSLPREDVGPGAAGPPLHGGPAD